MLVKLFDSVTEVRRWVLHPSVCVEADRLFGKRARAETMIDIWLESYWLTTRSVGVFEMPQCDFSRVLAAGGRTMDAS